LIEYRDFHNCYLVRIDSLKHKSYIVGMQRSGLTLIELLVTIGILAVLIAVLIPAIHNSRLQGKVTVCASNVRQIGITLLAYAADNGKFPYGFYNDPNLPSPEEGYAGYGQYDRLGWWWFNYPEGLYNKKMGKRTILECPSKNIRYPKLEDDILCGNYGVNLSVCKLPLSQGKTN
jgi:prepilin-type N-terminal cleavage/methylation domain-containing protein